MHLSSDTHSSPRSDTSGARPNTFIVGAPKCGTTALAAYLRGHPDVFVSDPKEPNYFSTDLPRGKLTGLEDYLRLFRDSTDRSVRLEASTFYLASSEATRNILAFDPEARIIAMVRNPVELVYSLHWQQVFSLEEPITDFEQAWRAQDSRGHEGFRFRYGHIGALGTQLSRLFETCPEHQRLVIVYDDFRKSPRDAYRDVLTFLGLSDDATHREFPVINASKEWRNPLLAELMLRTPPPIQSVVRHGKRLLGIKRLGFSDFLLRLNVRRRQRVPMSAQLAIELTEHFRDEVRLLGDLLGRDFSHWQDTPAVEFEPS